MLPRPNLLLRTRTLLALAVLGTIPSGCISVRFTECGPFTDNCGSGPLLSNLHLGSCGDPPTELPLEHDSCGELLATAEQLEKKGDARCVDWYFAATRAAWQDRYTCPGGDDPWASYNAALAELLRAGQCFRRLDPRQGLVVHQGAEVLVIPVVHHRFVWAAEDFQKLLPPPTGGERYLTRRYERRGIGTPVVVERRQNSLDPNESRFMPSKSWFSATAVMRFDQAPSSHRDVPPFSTPVLEFHDPLRVCKLRIEGEGLELACDQSAALAVALKSIPATYLAGFLQPGQLESETTLRFLESYQPGKIPVVLIHGLYSDPGSCWADLINDLRSCPSFVERYQLWFFRYPTGAVFLQSAATLRQELQAAADQLGSGASDDSLQQMVLIGHSMGGLVAKLQITSSEDKIWRRVSNRPFDEIQTTASTRAFLAQGVFFEPASHVRRVVFIATPHQGSSEANALIGRLASSLVQRPEEVEARQRQLARDNPGAFTSFVARGLPTTVDLLETSSPLLEAMREMQIPCYVRLHDIIGVACPLGLSGPSDGIVSASSAEHPGYTSRLYLPKKHTSIHRSTEAATEVMRILDEHWRETREPKLNESTTRHLEAEPPRSTPPLLP